MRVFVAGATGVIGRRLVPLLVAAGHQVMGMSRSPERAGWLEEMGATAVVVDVFDAADLAAAVRDAAPDLIVHQLTDLPDDARLLPTAGPGNNRIRREGTRNLLSAARAAGAKRLVAQSVAWELPGEGGAAVRFLEQAVLAAGGTVLRYGQLYGPGTYHEDVPPPPPRIHADEAAARTLAALDHGPGILTLTEDATQG